MHSGLHLSMALHTGHLNSFAGAVSAARTAHTVSPTSAQAGAQLVMLVIDACMRCSSYI